MKRKQRYNFKILLDRGILLAVLVLISACAQAPSGQDAGRNISPSLDQGQPKYKPGTVFVYSNGSWDKVESTNGGTVTWLNHKGNRSSGFADFTFRPTKWESTNFYGEREFTKSMFLFDEIPTKIWPLKAGQSSGFVEENRWKAKSGVMRRYTAYWSCRVDGQEQVIVPAGTFDTWKVTCARYSGSMKKNTAFAREYRTWYYAPKISHWAAMEKERVKSNGRTFKRRELVAILPDLADLPEEVGGRRALEKFYQSVLEEQPSGSTSLWKTNNNKVVLTMTPTETFRRKNNMVCRQYHQVLKIDGSEEPYYGMACRNKKGKWSVPRKG